MMRYEVFLSAASENILLAAHAIGLGGVWTCIYTHEERMAPARSILNVPDNMVPFNLMPIGHPLADHAPMDKWHPEKVHQNRLRLSPKRIMFDTKFEPSGITDGSFAFVEATGCQRGVNRTL